MPLNNIHIAVIVSRFNHEVTQKLFDGAEARLKELNIADDHKTCVWVPGAIEIPITAQRLALMKKFSAIICLGAVIMGETKHFDYVCQQVSYGCQQVALSHNVPVIFGVLTTDTEEQAHARAGGTEGHAGRNAVDTAYDLIKTLAALKQ